MAKIAIRDHETADTEFPIPTEDVLALRAKHLMPLPGPMYSKPIQIVKGEGCSLFDEKGRKYVDGFAGVATVSIGHCHPHWVKKLREQMEQYFHSTTLYLHPSLGLYAERLIAKVKAANPDLEMCYFTNSGSEANELAALLAKNHTGSADFLALRHSYHGRTLMTMALTGQASWRHSGPYGQSVNFVEANYPYRGHFWKECAADLEETIRYATSGKIAAFYAEPINGVGGAITPEPEYFAAAYAAVKKAGGLFVADEVQTGVYRTGKNFLGIQNWGVKPDIVTMAKGLGNGYPIGAVITTRAVVETMKGKAHYNTFGGSPAQMAAANAVMDVLESENLDDNVVKVGSHLLSRFKALAEKSPNVGEARGKGLMLGLELVKDKKTKKPAPELTLAVLDRCQEAGILVGKGGAAGNVVRVKPPLCLSLKEADLIADALEDALLDKKFTASRKV